MNVQAIMYVDVMSDCADVQSDQELVTQQDKIQPRVRFRKQSSELFLYEYK